MCGSEARLCSAYPLSCSQGANRPYVMFASTITCFSASFSMGSLRMSVSDKKPFLLSAIVLKQCLVPSTFSFSVFLTYSFTSATDFAAFRFSVLYSMFPAQFFSFSGTLLFAPSLATGDKIASAPTAPASFRNVLFFMVEGRSRRIREGMAKSLQRSRKRQDCTSMIDARLRLIFAELFHKPARSYLQSGRFAPSAHGFCAAVDSLGHEVSGF